MDSVAFQGLDTDFRILFAYSTLFDVILLNLILLSLEWLDQHC